MRRATRSARLLPSALCGVLALSLLAGCKDPAEPGDSLYSATQSGSVVFIARTDEPSGYYDALFSGAITVDSAGCLRMEGLERHTPVWPKGYRLEITSGGGVVRRGDGSMVGTIGGQFVLGGGETQSLEWVTLSAADRERLTSSCPGRYWLVAP